jgi:hypothetical protein
MHRRLLFTSLVIGLVGGWSICAADATSNPGPRAKADARAYLVAAYALETEINRASNHAQRVVVSSSIHCQPTYRSESRAIQRKIQLETYSFEQVVQRTLTVSPYARFARKLSIRRAQENSLRRIEDAVRRLQPELAKLAKADVDFCMFLKKWKMSGWSDRFASAWYIGFNNRAGVRAGTVARAEADIFASRHGLERLGLKPAQADSLIDVAAPSWL